MTGYSSSPFLLSRKSIRSIIPLAHFCLALTSRCLLAIRSSPCGAVSVASALCFGAIVFPDDERGNAEETKSRRSRGVAQGEGIKQPFCQSVLEGVWRNAVLVEVTSDIHTVQI
jgi:hypothetical protein